MTSNACKQLAQRVYRRYLCDLLSMGQAAVHAEGIAAKRKTGWRADASGMMSPPSRYRRAACCELLRRARRNPGAHGADLSRVSKDVDRFRLHGLALDEHPLTSAVRT